MAKMGEKIALVLIDHGSRLPESSEVLLQVVQRLRATNRFHFVAGAHMDIEQPSLKSAVETCFFQGADKIVVVPFFLSPGRHSTGDIPSLAREVLPEGYGTKLIVAEPMGKHPALVQVVLDRAAEALGMPLEESVLLHADRASLLVVDLQTRLLPHIDGCPAVISSTIYMIRAAKELGIPIVVTEQYPDGLGPTDPQILEVLPPETASVAKTCFSCFGDSTLVNHLNASRPRLILCGVEAHVCVMQTALEAQRFGWEPCVIVDAIASRKSADCQAALHRMEQAGITLASAEMAVYELLREAGTPQFKSLLPMLKEGPSKFKRTMGFHGR